MKEKLILIIATLIEILVIVLCVVSNSNIKDKINNYHVYENSQSVHGAMKENNATVVILKAPIKGSPTPDQKHYLRDNWGISDEHLLYVCYTQQKYVRDTDSDGKTTNKWTDKGRETYYSPEVYIYDDIRISPLNCYKFKDANHLYYYPDGDDDIYRIGDIRYSISYVTDMDTITCLADIGDGILIVKPIGGHYDIVFNEGIDAIEKSATTGGTAVIIVSIIVYICILFVIKPWKNIDILYKEF